MNVFSIASLSAWILVALAAGFLRGRPFVFFAAVLVGVYTFCATSIAPAIANTPFWWPFVAAHCTVYLHLLLLARPAMRPLWYRTLVSVPGSYLFAAAVLSLPWGIAVRFGFHPWAVWLPFIIALIGVWQSLTSRRGDVHIPLSDEHVETLSRWKPGHARVDRPLKIVQITDPHLGAFMSVKRLRGICERAVAADPDLIVLTGDFLTMESQGRVEHLRDALAPLATLTGRTFACHGNHDHEAPRVVAEALAANGIKLLVDRAEIAQTPFGDIEVLGFDYAFSNRAARIATVAAAHPRADGLLRIALLHDPGAFKHVPPGTADLVLSGHTHGGHIGFVSLGGNWTVPRMLDMPDHGLWARARDRLYVHRGTGHYGFPLRLGVPAEESVLYVHSNRS